MSITELIALLRHEQYRDDEHVDDFSQGWNAALRHVAQLLECREEASQ